MQVSHSRISTFLSCPFKYDLKYNKKWETLFNCDPQNALTLGHAIHTGIEKNVDEAIEEYYSAYPIIDDLHVNEAIKLKYLIPKVKEILPEGLHEVKIEDDDYVGFIDLLVPVGTGLWLDAPDGPQECEYYDIYDFKYSNNVDHYLESEQLHLYKYYFNKTNPGKRISNLYFVFIPKTMIRQKKDEDLFQFRKRIISELEQKEIQIEQVNYESSKVIDFLTKTKHCIECEDYEKNPTKLCNWCEYKNYCEKGEMIDMLLPKNERVEIDSTNYMKGWIYGPPFSGKTTFLDSAPSPLNLNTDGNTKYVTMQRLRIRDKVTVEGRQTKRKFAWEIFKEAIEELEKKQNDFETIIVDLVEDTREMCRLYMYDKYGWEHETDGGYGKGWDVIKTEYLSTMRKFFNLDYNCFIVSHEDTSKDLTKSSGDKVTRIAPNIQEGIANKLAGMVDFVARVVINKDDSRSLSFKTNNVIFGGGRLHIDIDEIPLDWEELLKVYEEANKKATVKKEAPKSSSKKETISADVSNKEESENVSEDAPATQTDESEQREEKPVRRTRKRRTSDDN